MALAYSLHVVKLRFVSSEVYQVLLLNLKVSPSQKHSKHLWIFLVNVLLVILQKERKLLLEELAHQLESTSPYKLELPVTKCKKLSYLRFS